MAESRSELYWIFGVYTLLIFGIAYYIFSKQKAMQKEAEDSRVSVGQKAPTELEHHFLGGKDTPTILLVLTTFSTIFSGYTMVGVPQEQYKRGFFGTRWIAFIVFVAHSFMIITPRLRTIFQVRKYSSPIDFISDRYRSNTLRLGILSAIYVADFFYLTGQMAAINSLVETITLGEVSGLAGCIFFGVIILVMEALGGLKSVMFTDAIQSILMILTLFIVPIVSSTLYGSFPDLLKAKNCEFTKEGTCGTASQAVFNTDPSSTAGFQFAGSAFAILSYAILPQCIQRVYTSNRAASLRVVIMVLLLCPFLTMVPGTLMGTIAAARFNKLPGTAFGIIGGELYDHGGFAAFMGCIMMCGALAAISSTADSALIAMSQMMSEDVYKKTFRPAATDDEVVLSSKFQSFIVVVVAIALGTWKDFALPITLKLMLAMQVISFSPYLLGLYPDIFGRTPSSRSFIWGFFMGGFVVLGLLIFASVTKKDLFFDAGIWGFFVEVIVVLCMELFCSKEYLDDDKRAYDLPPIQARAHMIPFPNEITNTEATESAAGATVAAVESKNKPGGNDEEEGQKSVCAKEGATVHEKRLSDEFLQAVGLLNENEPMAIFKDTKPLFPSLGGPIMSNRALMGWTVVVVLLSCPVWTPGKPSVYVAGWPEWMWLYTGGCALGSIMLMILAYQWVPPTEDKSITDQVVQLILAERKAKAEASASTNEMVTLSPLQQQQQQQQ